MKELKFQNINYLPKIDKINTIKMNLQDVQGVKGKKEVNLKKEPN